jgi:DNA-binding MarR family transcriptional regulator
MSDSLTTTSLWQALPGPDANLGYLFRLAHQRFRTLLEDQLRELGLSAQEYVVLSVFETRAELSTSELARITQVTRQTMHTSIVRLETAGLLSRRAENQRVVLVAPTKRGRATLKRATARVRTVERTALGGVSRKDERIVRGWLADVASIAARPEGTRARPRVKS